MHHEWDLHTTPTFSGGEGVSATPIGPTAAESLDSPTLSRSRVHHERQRAPVEDISRAASIRRHGPQLPLPVDHQRQLSFTAIASHDHTSPGGYLGLVTALDDLSNDTYAPSEFAAGASTVSASIARIYLDTPVWPLQVREEAVLMRHFIITMAPYFDLCDPRRHFALVVPQRAIESPVLLNAIFASSARHLSRIRNFEATISDRYHQECLKHLIPLLSDNAAVMDENLLAATIILRFLEEVEGKPLVFLCGCNCCVPRPLLIHLHVGYIHPSS
jgi:Fungal specific transcription factor domain